MRALDVARSAAPQSHLRGKAGSKSAHRAGLALFIGIALCQPEVSGCAAADDEGGKASGGGSAGSSGSNGSGGSAAGAGGGSGAAGAGAAAGAGGASGGAGQAGGMDARTSEAEAGGSTGDTGAMQPEAEAGGEDTGAPGVDASIDGEVAPGSSAAPVFDGASGYVEIPDDDVFSEPAAGALTVEAWMRPDSLAMPNRESTGYVHWLGKGESGQHEWVSRMYQAGNSEGRVNRISFYSFNLTGGLGAGSYFQDTVQVGEWIHYVGEFDSSDTYIYKNGVQRDSDPLSGYSITPGNGTAPVRIATRDFASFFQGSIARVAIYRTRLSVAQLLAHYEAYGTGTYDAAILSEPDLVGYWKLDETSGTVAADSKGGRHGTYHGTVALGAATFRP